MFIYYRGAPQEHVSGVKTCEFHPTPEQGTVGRVRGHASVNCPLPQKSNMLGYGWGHARD